MQIIPDASGVAAAARGVVQAQDTGSPSAGSSSSTSTATVTANDFLQLLIAEMKNQDPTTSTDPTQYISQLVQVNSLEQLVQINQDLGGGTTASTGSSGDATHGPGNGASQPASTAAAGNLSTGNAANTTSAATRVASSLGTEKNAPNAAGANVSGTAAGNPYDAILAAMRRRANTTPTTTTSPAR